MRLSEPQKQLLAEIQSGEARYIRRYSRYGRTLASLREKGLVRSVFADRSWDEVEITEAGAAWLVASRSTPT